MAYKRPVIAVFASGGGSTFQAVADAISDGLVDFDTGLVITDQENAGVLDRVADINRRHGFDIKTAIINKKRYPGGAQVRGQTQQEAEALLDILEKNNIDHMALMGCLRILAPQVVNAWGWKPQYAKKDPQNKGMYFTRVTNTHPGILPDTGDTYGIHTQEKVLKNGLHETAHTFHAVAAGIDTGPIIAQHKVRVFAPSKYPKEMADTPEKLFARVQRVEKGHLPLDIDAFLKNQINFNQKEKN